MTSLTLQNTDTHTNTHARSGVGLPSAGIFPRLIQSGGKFVRFSSCCVYRPADFTKLQNNRSATSKKARCSTSNRQQRVEKQAAGGDPSLSPAPLNTANLNVQSAAELRVNEPTRTRPLLHHPACGAARSGFSRECSCSRPVTLRSGRSLEGFAQMLRHDPCTGFGLALLFCSVLF